jgi:hypothetical protein
MNFGGILKGALPWLGAAITGGPVGLAAMALKTVGDKLGVKAPKNAAEAEALYVNATPEQRLALKQEDDNFAVRMKELGIQEVEDLEKIAADDRASARNREIQVKDRTPQVLAYVYATAFFLTLGLHIWFLAYITLNHVQIDLAVFAAINTPVSMLETALLTMVLGSKEYYFGSSSGSRAKDDTIAGLSTK